MSEVQNEEKLVEDKFLENKRNYEISYEKNNTNRTINYTWAIVIGFIGVIISLAMGFYKMFIYENSDSYFEESINTYVGGDAYNYIINGTYTVAYFVLALVFMVYTATMMILNVLKNKYS
ncbi:hypothetical protein [Ureibacillus aquaedulcis]|uniref:Uncharacterized protein n=1 Tax=Ureibacillus aquaedulcis TaxID=3058421 RepID=A0ABT8GVI2_9BACL|nr:hypothetical protein [Ureibacillus sp. BA0131]MDN4494921.1 hypothetical protein [Ureibacillus sp. BA0131]